MKIELLQIWVLILKWSLKYYSINVESKYSYITMLVVKKKIKHYAWRSKN